MVEKSSRKLKVVNVIANMDNGGAQRIILNYLMDLHDDDDIEFVTLVINSSDKNSYCYKIIKKNNYKVTFLDPYRSRIPYLRRFINKYFARKAINNYFKKISPDVVHVHISELLDVILEPIVKNKIPIRFDTLHSNPYRYKGRKLDVIRKAFQNENFIPICITKEQAIMAKEYYGFDRYEIVRNGIDVNSIKNGIISKSDARALYNLGVDDYVVIGVGRLNKVKRFDILINSFKKVSELNEKAVLLIAGDGPEKDSLLKIVDSLRLTHKVQFLGNLDNVVSLYCAADILAITSDTESSSLTLLEAQICNLRSVISSGVPSESIITDKVMKMDRESSFDDWSNAIMNQNYIGNKVMDIADYEVHTQSQVMKRVYLKYWEELDNGKK